MSEVKPLKLQKRRSGQCPLQRLHKLVELLHFSFLFVIVGHNKFEVSGNLCIILISIYIKIIFFRDIQIFIQHQAQTYSSQKW